MNGIMETQLNLINPFIPNAPFLYPLKTCLQRVENGRIRNEWVNTVLGTLEAAVLRYSFE